MLNIKVDFDSLCINKSVTSVCEDLDLYLNIVVNVNGCNLNLNFSVVVKVSNNLDYPSLDSDGFSVDFSLSVIFKILDQRSPVVDDDEFLLSIVASPVDSKCLNFVLNFYLDLEGEVSNSSVGIISKSIAGNLNGSFDGDQEVVDLKFSIDLKSIDFSFDQE